ncbi:hypothetical protein L1F30_06110 [Simiduia sp. 21SJ11W-1]|uniref:hypothetical protein n=1 Tax=Simiduia sp. 21SJ11W-1 TaxID=2909669 RepID=UPI0020A0E9FF|nr:hypothetical protein [Simiduia sp. 21SJ11W-1]UTA49118.1 hypothetical protein L1F30_06110 [Simiduia sp. 21SJ11W-1]
MNYKHPLILTLLLLSFGCAPISDKKYSNDFVSETAHQEILEAKTAHDNAQYNLSISKLDKILKDHAGTLSQYQLSQIYLLQASANSSLGDIDKSVESYEKISQLKDIPPSLRNMALDTIANVYFTKYQYEEVILALNQRDNSISPMALEEQKILAWSYHEQGDSCRALEILNSLKTNSPKVESDYFTSIDSLARQIQYQSHALADCGS